MSSKIDETGNRYGRLVVVREARARPPVHWYCKCDCGKYKVVNGAMLRRGATVSCGCYHQESTGDRYRGKHLPKKVCQKIAKTNTINLRKKRYGKLLVLDKPPCKKYNHIYWHCQCDCGKRKTVYGYFLRSGKVRSCGCQRNK